MKFINSARPIDPAKEKPWIKQKSDLAGYYSYDKPSIYLFQWSRLFQSVISQVGSFIFNGKYHDQEVGIYKAEGGCRIDKFGDLVLGEKSCYFNYFNDKLKDKLEILGKLISHIVLSWEPNNPIESMLNSAIEFAHKNCSHRTSVEELSECLTKQNKASMVFGGNALADFFNWNPFCKAPIDRDYQRFCLIKFNGYTEEQVNKKFEIEDYSQLLLAEINRTIKKSGKNGYASALCCSPKIDKDGNVIYWINTGRSTQIDYWKTEQEILDFINSDGILINKIK